MQPDACSKILLDVLSLSKILINGYSFFNSILTSIGVYIMSIGISVVGLGKLGASMVAGFAEVGFEVIGYDIVERNVRLINSGVAPVEETDLTDYIERNKSKITD